ncbi:MAG: hypothetical protein ABIS69_02735 [Sediminibacterium sp.]
MKHFLLLILFALSANYIFSQGCSDAGFCSLGALKDVSQGTSHKQSIDFGANIGFGEQNTFSLNPYVQYNLPLNKHVSLLGKLTATYASGFLGRAFNVGDFYGVATYTPNKDAVNSLRLLGGFKIPFTSANSKSAAGLPLPLDYQSSIGTYDIITGINYIIHGRLEFDAGLQAPIIQVNKNTFFADEYTDPKTMKFASTNNFRRKADVLFRAGYYIKLNSSVTIKPNLLAIYHLGEDTYENRFGKRTVIKGSDGLTLNGGITASKQFTNGNRLEAIVATPFVVRDTRADGLTRNFVFNLQYSIAF